MKEEKCIRINGNENVILKLGDKTAFDHRFFLGRFRSADSLQMFSLKMQLEARQSKYHFPVVIRILKLGMSRRSSTTASTFDRVCVVLFVTF